MIFSLILEDSDPIIGYISISKLYRCKNIQGIVVLSIPIRTEGECGTNEKEA
jgi:hypothetical protein